MRELATSQKLTLALEYVAMQSLLDMYVDLEEEIRERVRRALMRDCLVLVYSGDAARRIVDSETAVHVVLEVNINEDVASLLALCSSYDIDVIELVARDLRLILARASL